ncbi:hypothetical protein ACQP2P_34010 [Dactylosporangium sp. CA-139114]|uniref:hypothetical protein n=1 Tax=Dactylosporangium sp. CA-139114 TaxID=3239931 RepID=UPI003D954E49
MLDPRFVLCAVAFNIFGTAWYVRGAIRNTVRPHPVTWLVWAVAPGVAFVVQVGSSVGLQSILTLVVAANPAVVFAVLLRDRDVRWSVSGLDVLCGGLALIALVAWVTFRDAGASVMLAVTADLLAAVPTFRKAWKDPHSESLMIYACVATSAGITLLTVDRWSLAEAGFATYLGALGVTMTIIVAVARRRPRQGKRATLHPPGGCGICQPSGQAGRPCGGCTGVDSVP